MFNNSNGYSLSDIAAATSGGMDGFGNNSAWWIIVLFLFAFGGWGGNGWGNNTPASTTVDVSAALDANTIKTGISDGFYALNTGLLNGFSNMQAQLCNNNFDTIQAINANTVSGLQNANALQAQIAQVSADERLSTCQIQDRVDTNFATLNYNLATEACADRAAISNGIRDVVENANNNTRQILDFLVQDRLNALNSENASLRAQISQSEQNAYLVNALRPPVVPSYNVPNPYAYSGYGYTTGCGCTGM